MMDRAAKRFGSAKVEDGPGKNEQKTEKMDKDPETKTAEMKPNAVGATVEAEHPHAQMHGRHAEELKAMHGRHMQEIKDMHGRHADELTQMHGRHAVDVGTPPPTEGPKLKAGKGWKTRDKGPKKDDKK